MEFRSFLLLHPLLSIKCSKSSVQLLLSAKGKSLTSTERLKHRQNGFFSCQDKFLKSQLLGCKSSMSLTFKIYTDLYTSHFNTHCHLSPSRWIHSQQPCVSSIFHQVLRVGQFQPGQKTKNESRFVFCISRFVLGVFRLAFKIHSLRLRTVVTSMAALVNCTSNFRKTEVPSIATGSHLHFKKHNKTRQNDKTSRRHAQVKKEKTTQVTEFHLSVWRFRSASKRTTRRGALSVFPHVRSHARFMRDLYISYLFP